MEAVISVMRKHEGHADVQCQGCWALKNLAVNAGNKVVVKDL
jgi:hypothetical protein